MFKKLFSRNLVAVVNPFPVEPGLARIIQSSKTGDEPNATLHFPLRTARLRLHEILIHMNEIYFSQSNNDNYDSDDDVNGVPIEEDEEDARPYKVCD